MGRVNLKRRWGFARRPASSAEKAAPEKHSVYQFLRDGDNVCASAPPRFKRQIARFFNPDRTLFSSAPLTSFCRAMAGRLQNSHRTATLLLVPGDLQ